MSHDNITELSDTLTASFPLSDASPKDKPWDKHRANSDTVKGMYQEVGYERYADRIQECSQRLIFALQQADNDGERLFHLTGARFCRVRHCPVCQWRRSLMWRARFFKAIPGLLGDYPKARFIFLTLTVRNCPLDELRETIGWMNQAWVRLTKRKQFPALGWVKSVEVTRGEDGSAHPHFHVVLMVKPSYFSHGYLSQADWTQLWKQSLRVEYTPVVNVKAIKGKGDEKGIFIALCETLKYSVKEDDLKFDKNWLQGVTQQLHKTRAVSLGGIFKSYLSDDEPEDLIHTELGEEEVPEEAPEFTFSWRETLKKYMSD
jgi:plasmid rolling circle replication initiator protein Rep